jgi:serine/threonine-protein kinase
MPRSTTSRSSESALRGALALVAACAIVVPIASTGWSAPTAADFEQAKALVLEGRRLRDVEKKPAEALRRFEAAHKLAGTTITGLDLAKTYELLGRLVDALSTYEEVGRIPERATDSKVAKDARVEAATKAGELRGRIAHLSFEIAGAPSDASTSIVLDGATLPPEALLIARAVDPGPHTVVLKVAGMPDRTESVTLKDGETRALHLSAGALPRLSPTLGPKPVESALPATSASAPPIASAPPPAPSASAPPIASASTTVAPPPPRAVDRGDTQRTAGLVIGGAGLLGLGIGTFVGLSARSDARGANCDANDVCATSNDVTIRANAVSKAKTASGILGIGGALLATGAIVWLSAPSGDDEGRKTGVTSVGLTPTGVIVGGAF